MAQCPPLNTLLHPRIANGFKTLNLRRPTVQRVVSDRTKTRMKDKYSFAIFLVALLRVKIKLWVRLDQDTV